MHMHKQKKASVIVVDGKLTIHFLNNQQTLHSGGRSVLRPGLFHRLAVDEKCSHPAIILEVENNSDRNDIIRLQDNYGRTFKKYEWSKGLLESLSSIGLESKFPGDLALDGRSMLITEEFSSRDKIQESSNYIIIEGGLVDRCGTFVAEAGDVLSGNTLIRLCKRFELLKSMVIKVTDK